MYVHTRKILDNFDPSEFILMANQEPSSTDDEKTTGHVAGDDGYTRWRNLFSLLTGKMDEVGKEQYRVARDERMEEADCKRCESQRDFLLQYSMLTCIS